jgi:hypothetical protein
MKRLGLLIAGLAITLGVLAAPVAVSAVDNFPACNGVTDSLVCKNSTTTAQPIIKTVINTLVFLVGIVSVIVMIIGGIMYTVSAGNAGTVTKAKSTIVYALVGMVVAFLAYAIVNWVMKNFGA